MAGSVVLSPPLLSYSPASEAASFHLSHQAPREHRLLIGCEEQAALPAAVTQGFRCETRAGEAIRTSVVGSVPRRLKGQGYQGVCIPERLSPSRENHTDSTRGLRPWGQG